LATVTAGELAEWAGFYALEPWGYPTDERRAARQLAYTSAGPHVNPADLAVLHAEDRRRSARAQSTAEQKAALSHLRKPT